MLGGQAFLAPPPPGLLRPWEGTKLFIEESLCRYNKALLNKCFLFLLLLAVRVKVQYNNIPDEMQVNHILNKSKTKSI